MRYALILIMVLFVSPAFASEKSCYSKTVPFQSVNHDKESVINLEARRVISINNNSFTYNLGKETITITADSFASQRFINSVKEGRCSAHETVKLVPERKSSFNTKFKAERSH